MNYNDIIIPLRLIAIGIASGICIFFLCSFNHPFDLHYNLEAIYEEMDRREIQEAIDKIDREIMMRTPFYTDREYGNYEPNYGKYNE